MRWVVRVLVDQVSAAHHLPGYPGPCAKPHGHNWSLEAVVGAEELAEDMVVDFALVRRILSAPDHTDLNDDPELAGNGHRPTAERLAAVLATRLQNALDALPNRPRVLRVTVRETKRSEVVLEP